jgi:hypothetical protein
MLQKIYMAGTLAATSILLNAGPVLAQVNDLTCGNTGQLPCDIIVTGPGGSGLPGPGILGLVAFGVVGAIVLAKTRK